MVAMHPGRLWFAILIGAATLLGQADQPSSNTKIFGPPPPDKTDKQLLRSVSGTIRDPDGNAVSGATVYLKEPQSGKERATVAGPTGGYRFDDLHKKYDYQLRAANGKLVSSTKTLSNFDTRHKPVMNLTLEPTPAKPEAAGEKK